MVVVPWIHFDSPFFYNSVPIDVHDIPENRNQFAATKHYLRKRQAAPDIALTSVYGDVLYCTSLLFSSLLLFVSLVNQVNCFFSYLPLTNISAN
jgi:hypothetical protein